MVYLRGTCGVLLVYDISNLESFTNVQKWLKDIENFGHENVQKLLIGNKSDLSERQVKLEEAEKLAQKFGLEFLELSAKNSKTIDTQEIFVKITEAILGVPEF
eukprot:TRINITY_DN22309_c0_g1_i1.p1 TRINITY_DN22309_c0_g1~~TRINITY_DN22309_c0_g1_i1.p1  ORF type:complete len:103 (-),score=19.10 TRINITY_DN22309_c0_g1_i1:24-332(-)